jgi:hypothetical protein
MSNIPKVPSVSNVTPTQKTPNATDRSWESGLKTPIDSSVSSVKTMQIPLERSPQNVTNQNATLSPKQMAEHLSRELLRRTAQNKATKGTSKNSFDKDISAILDGDKGLSSLLESADSNTIAAFLAAFQSEMEKHLSGMEFGNIVYDQELIDMIMGKY